LKTIRPIDDDRAWLEFRQQHWKLRADTIYLNHGSFGPPPVVVQQARESWQRQLDEQPMDFFVRRMESELRGAREKLAAFVGTKADNLVLVDNATYAINVVARSFKLAAGDEVLLTDHEYGAVKRIWQRACDEAGANLRIAKLPLPMESPAQVVDAIASALGPRTRLLVVSHITSPTAITLPVAEICAAAKAANVSTCIDGPHAIAQVPVEIDALGCDFYAASCHKWLSAPLGSGFLLAAPHWHQRIAPPVLSWGKQDTQRGKQSWQDEFDWLGTRDPAACLAIPTAIEFLQSVGLDAFRQRTHFLAQYAREELQALANLTPIVPDSPDWYVSMAHVPLPPGESRPLQRALWEQYKIEVPIISFADQRWVRVSCHLYTQRSDIDALAGALRRLL
jgi:isopenicillin-N epimerase